jgi:hypothetical protein
MAILNFPLPQQEEELVYDDSFSTDIESAKARFEKLAKLALSGLDAYRLNLAALHLAMWIDQKNRSMLLLDQVQAELHQDRKKRLLARPRPKVVASINQIKTPK